MLRQAQQPQAQPPSAREFNKKVSETLSQTQLMDTVVSRTQKLISSIGSPMAELVESTTIILSQKIRFVKHSKKLVSDISSKSVRHIR